MLAHRPPTVADPHWRDRSGARTTVGVSLAEHPESDHGEVLERHADAISEVIHAAARSRLAGDQRRARSLASQASKLCGELAGLWPEGSHEPLR